MTVDLTLARTLVGGPYDPPAYQMGDVVPCLVRDYDVRVVGTSEGRIPWPVGERARLERGKCRKRGIIVEDVLARAVATEANVTVAWHWGVSVATVCRWRAALAVPRMTPGTTAVYSDAFTGTEKAAKAWQGRLAPSVLARQAQTLSASTRGRRIVWAVEDDQLLLTLGARPAAAALGRSVAACNARLFRLRHEIQ